MPMTEPGLMIRMHILGQRQGPDGLVAIFAFLPPMSYKLIMSRPA